MTKSVATGVGANQNASGEGAKLKKCQNNLGFGIEWRLNSEVADK